MRTTYERKLSPEQNKHQNKTHMGEGGKKKRKQLRQRLQLAGIHRTLKRNTNGYTLATRTQTSFREMEVKRRQMTHRLCVSMCVCVRARLLLNINTLSCECTGSGEEETLEELLLIRADSSPLGAAAAFRPKQSSHTLGRPPLKVTFETPHAPSFHTRRPQPGTRRPTRLRVPAYPKANHPHHSH